MSEIYEAAVAVILTAHLAWILWVIFGAFWTRGRLWLTAFHLLSLVWGIVVEVSSWPCPLTLAEDHFQRLGGGASYHRSFIVHYLSAAVYPNAPVLVLTVSGVAICALNIGVYGWRWRITARHPKGN